MGLKDFQILDVIGEGAFASVVKVQRHSDKEVYAMKRVNVSLMERKELQNTLNEVRILASVRHPYIVGYYDSFLANNNKELCLVLEFCGQGDLGSELDALRRRRLHMDESKVWRYFGQMLEALKVLHENGICHRDVKAANCFLGESGEVKLGDMNISKRMKGGALLQTQTGTPYFMSPEIWAQQAYSTLADMWALGCLTYEMASLKKPFTADSFPELCDKVSAGKYSPLPKQYSEQLSKVIARMLVVDPKKRSSAKELMADEKLKEMLQAANVIITEPDDAVSLLDTIPAPFPSMIHRIEDKLPRACYPDARPFSPESWPARHRSQSPVRRSSSRRRSSGYVDPSSSAHNSGEDTGSTHGNGQPQQRGRRAERQDRLEQRESSKNRDIYRQPSEGSKRSHSKDLSRHRSASKDSQNSRPSLDREIYKGRERGASHTSREYSGKSQSSRNKDDAGIPTPHTPNNKGRRNRGRSGHRRREIRESADQELFGYSNGLRRRDLRDGDREKRREREASAHSQHSYLAEITEHGAERSKDNEERVSFQDLGLQEFDEQNSYSSNVNLRNNYNKKERVINSARSDHSFQSNASAKRERKNMQRQLTKERRVYQGREGSHGYSKRGGWSASSHNSSYSIDRQQSARSHVGMTKGLGDEDAHAYNRQNSSRSFKESGGNWRPGIHERQPSNPMRVMIARDRQTSASSQRSSRMASASSQRSDKRSDKRADNRHLGELGSSHRSSKSGASRNWAPLPSAGSLDRELGDTYDFSPLAGMGMGLPSFYNQASYSGENLPYVGNTRSSDNADSDQESELSGESTFIDTLSKASYSSYRDGEYQERRSNTSALAGLHEQEEEYNFQEERSQSPKDACDDDATVATRGTQGSLSSRLEELSAIEGSATHMPIIPKGSVARAKEAARLSQSNLDLSTMLANHVSLETSNDPGSAGARRHHRRRMYPGAPAPSHAHAQGNSQSTRPENSMGPPAYSPRVRNFQSTASPPDDQTPHAGSSKSLIEFSDQNGGAQLQKSNSVEMESSVSERVHGRILRPLDPLPSANSDLSVGMEDLSQQSDFSRRNSFPASGGQKLQSLTEERVSMVSREAMNSRMNEEGAIA